MRGHRALVRPPWNQRQPSCRLSVICWLVSGPCLSPWLRWLIDWLWWAFRAHKPHMQHKGTRGQVVDPRHLLARTHLRVGFPDHGSLVFRGHHQQQHNTTQAEDIAKYKREYATLGNDFHHDMTLVEYYGLRGMNHPKEPQRGGQQQQQGHNIDFIRKVGKLTIPSFDRSSK